MLEHFHMTEFGSVRVSEAHAELLRKFDAGQLASLGQVAAIALKTLLEHQAFTAMKDAPDA